MKGIVRGALYPAKMQGKEIEVEVVDDDWGRCAEHSTWVRLADIKPAAQSLYATGGYTVGEVRITGSHLYLETYWKS